MLIDGVVTWSEIDLDAIAHNVITVQAFVGTGTEIIALIKGDAYGHGMLPVARTVLRAGATRLAVHRIPAAVALRTSGITAPILLLGHVPPNAVPLILHYKLTPTIIQRETAQALSALAETTIPIHIEIDTGISEYGLHPEPALALIRYIRNLPRLMLEGVYSHFATSDPEPIRKQWQLFQETLQAIERPVPLPHLCNSAGIVALPEAHLAAVRPGLFLYGMLPSETYQPPFPLRPALTLKTTVINVRELAAGTSISYNYTYTAPAPMVAALISLGHSDGYPRSLSNRGCVLINGQRAPIRGNIGMDQCVVDVTQIPNVRIGDEVVAIGPQGDDCLTVETVAAWAESSNYEITTGLSSQVVRRYRRKKAK